MTIAIAATGGEFYCVPMDAQMDARHAKKAPPRRRLKASISIGAKPESAHVHART